MILFQLYSNMSSFFSGTSDGKIKKLLPSFFIFTFLFMASIVQAGSPLQPHELTCEYIKNPLGIAEQRPRLTWTLQGSQRAQQQSAYELIVSDDLNTIRQMKGNVWESGKVLSSQNILLPYNGKSLQPFTRYYWRVKVYNQDGEVSDWSYPATFETAMLQASDWKGKWIGDGKTQFEKDEDFYDDDPMPLLRKTFNAKKSIASARLYVSGLGYYEGYLNGRKVGDHVLDPGWTTYKKQALYVTHDVTSLIQQGSNTFGFMLGNGWYNPLPLKLFGQFNLRNVQQTGRPCVKAQILIRYTDGSTETIVTDESWQTSTGPVVRNNVYLGEHYDARLEKKDWTSPANKLDWKNAVMMEGPSGNLTPQMQPPIRITTAIKPVSISEVGKDTFIVDMGQNFAGVARIKVRGPAGKKIVMRFGEAVHPDGRLNFLTTTAGHIKEMWNLKGGPGAPKTAWQEDSYILKGSRVEQWAPRFTFHGFRYIEVTGWPGKPGLNDIQGLRMNSDLQTSGSFTSCNTMFNKLQDVIRWTFLSNVFSVQSDCPGREKMGYGADIVVTAEAFLYNFDMAQFYNKTVRDYANEQQPDGGITEIAPYTGIADRGYGGHSGPLGWQLAFPYLQKKLYEFYGDKRVIEENYAGIKKQMQFLKSKEVSGLFHWDISDHESLDPRPEAFTAAAFYYHHALLAAEFAGILGKREDSTHYSKWSRAIKDAIVKKYLVPNTGRFDNATQAAQLFALWYGLAVDKDKSMNVLMQELARHNNHLSTGIYGTKMLFDVAREQNKNEVAYIVANQRSFPGWGHMLNEGATTLWESWKKPENATSLNHPMFGSISEWFYRSLLGINPAAPAFQRIIIKPLPAGDLTWAKGVYQSIQGPIGSDWKTDSKSFHLQVTIPANTTAEVWIAANANDKITESGKLLKEQKLEVKKYEDGFAVIFVPSGSYSFKRD
jgi:alpha-L-rhamnosidase